MVLASNGCFIGWKYGYVRNTYHVFSLKFNILGETVVKFIVLHWWNFIGLKVSKTKSSIGLVGPQ